MSAPATEEISDWLEKLGMSEYAERFAENGIDVSVLRYLTDQSGGDIDIPPSGLSCWHQSPAIIAAV